MADFGDIVADIDLGEGPFRVTEDESLDSGIPRESVVVRRVLLDPTRAVLRTELTRLGVSTAHLPTVSDSLEQEPLGALEAKEFVEAACYQPRWRDSVQIARNASTSVWWDKAEVSYQAAVVAQAASILQSIGVDGFA